MAARKGQVMNPNGRPKGSVNVANRPAREAIAAFVEGNTERLNSLLDRIAEDNPAKAFECIMSVVEYHIPKLNRTEMLAHVDVEHSVGSLPATTEWLASITGQRTQAPLADIVQE